MMTPTREGVQKPAESAVPIIAFTSGKGGCGKTTLAANFANVIAEPGQRVLLIDMDLSNRGLTGLFTEQTTSVDGLVTTTRLLEGAHAGCGIIEIKPELLLIPVSSASEDLWVEPADVDLESFSVDLRRTILDVAKTHKATCIVLDCFCGIDLVTTAGCSSADQVLIINEPDIVTFTGSTHLYFHLKRSMEPFVRKPHMGFVVNRMRQDMSVSELSELYRNNLEAEMGGSILAYFPYHSHVFESFGKVSLISDVIPKSLFVRKLKLLAYNLLSDEHADLIPASVRAWSRRRRRLIHARSIDPTAVSGDYLVLRLTQFPLLLGVWLVASALALRTFPLSPGVGVILQFLVVASGAAVAWTAIRSLWTTGMLNIHRARFYHRLSKVKSGFFARSRLYAKAHPLRLAGAMMCLLAAILGANLLFIVVYFLDYSGNCGLIRAPDAHWQDRLIDLSLTGFIRQVDLRGLELENVNLSTHSTSYSSSPHQMNLTAVLLPLDNWVLLGNTSFRNCQLEFEILEQDLKDCHFYGCSFQKTWYSDDLKVTWENIDLVDPINEMKRMPLIIVFDDSSRLTNVRFEYNTNRPWDMIHLSESRLDEVSVNDQVVTDLTKPSAHDWRVLQNIRGRDMRISPVQVAITREKVYWTDAFNDAILRANLDGSMVELVATESNPRGIAIFDGKVYWVAGRSLKRANVDGSEIVTLFRDQEGLQAITIANEKLYWSDSWNDKILRANLDGSEKETVLEDVPRPSGLTVCAGRIYWTDSGKGWIKSANLDGKDEKVLFSGKPDLGGIAAFGTRIYWVESAEGTIESSDLDGQDHRTLKNNLGNPLGIAVAEGSVYWTNTTAKVIRRVDTRNGNVETIIPRGR